MTNETATEDQFVVTPKMEGLALQILTGYSEYCRSRNLAARFDALKASVKDWLAVESIDTQRASVSELMHHLWGEAIAANPVEIPEGAAPAKKIIADQNILIRVDTFLREVAEREGLECPKINGISVHNDRKEIFR